jgi:hypothetical protein
MTNRTNPEDRIPTIRRLLLPAALGLLVVGSAACDVGDGSSAHPAVDDVDGGWKCDIVDDTARTSGSVTNHSSGTSTYFLTVDFGDDVASVTAEDVEPGETRMVSGVRGHVDGDLESCEVTDVERFSA